MRKTPFRFQFSLKPILLACSLAGMLFVGGFARAQGGQPGSAHFQSWLTTEVGHQLMTVPWYTVFDNLEYKVNGSEVILAGQVTNPAVKSDAESAVKSIEGVTKVTDNVEVLPPSPLDEQLRRAESRAIYSDPGLQKYGEGNLQAIHIIVDNGRVTLVGIVVNERDKDTANLKANTVPNVFSVTNNLKVQSTSASAK